MSCSVRLPAWLKHMQVKLDRNMDAFVEKDRVARREAREKKLLEEADAIAQRKARLASDAAAKQGRHHALARETAFLMIDVVLEVRVHACVFLYSNVSLLTSSFVPGLASVYPSLLEDCCLCYWRTPLALPLLTIAYVSVSKFSRRACCSVTSVVPADR